ncbi:hypothetical protein D3C85_1815110 [compost metagenome]
MPMKSVGRFEFFASPVIGKVEVLEAKIAPWGNTASTASMTAFFTSRSSKTASMTRSASASAL